jgi:hypothetical protein
VGPRVGGVDEPDSLEDPAVTSEDFLKADFLRVGTPSGHVHLVESAKERKKERKPRQEDVPRVDLEHSERILASPLHTKTTSIVQGVPFQRRNNLTLIFFIRQVRQPVLLRVYFGRFRLVGTLSWVCMSATM